MSPAFILNNLIRIDNPFPVEAEIDSIRIWIQIGLELMIVQGIHR